MTGLSRKHGMTKVAGGVIPTVSASYGPSGNNPQERTGLPDDFYERIKRRLHRRICRELRSAKRLLDIE